MRAIAALLLLLPSTAAAVAGPIDPRLEFRTTRTNHFVIHYHQGADAQAARLAAIAEEVHERLAGRAGPGHAARLTHVVLADQSDSPNGSATVVPWNAIVIHPAPPTGASFIGNTADWLEYVFTHEYSHVVHLDRSRGWARALRAVLGRNPAAFPNLSLPLWDIEGLATVEEALAGAGRLEAGDFREIVDAAARADRLEPLDRVNGGLVDWPGGHGWYAYGARFHEFLRHTYGEEAWTRLSAGTAGRLPYLTAGAYRATYGKPLGALWQEFQAAVTEEVEPRGTRPAQAHIQRLTRNGFVVEGPVRGPGGRVHVSISDPRRFPGIYRLEPDGRLTRVTSRYGGSGLTFDAGRLIFDQLDVVRGAALLSDLYEHDPDGGVTRRLTRGARLADPDVSPDGRLAAVLIGSGGRAIVRLDLQALRRAAPVDPGEVPIVRRTPDADAVYATPRWSPDGRLIAAERRIRDGRSEIVLLDGERLTPVAIAASWETGRRVTPAWSRDGRTLYFASDHEPGPFRIYAVPIADGRPAGPAREVVRVPGGARWPAVADDALVFVGYTEEGFDLFRTAAPHSPVPAGVMARAPSPPAPAAVGDAGEPASSRYAPWATLAPRTWLPLVDRRDGRWRLGAFAAGVDVLARHAFAAAATWAVTPLPGGWPEVPAARPDWSASYSYQRWQPAFYVAAEDRTRLVETVDPSGGVSPFARRERQIEAGVWRPFVRVRRTQTARLAYHAERVTGTTPDAVRQVDRAGLRAGWTVKTARRYGYSISPEDGWALAATAELLRPALGADGSAESFTADGRVYLPLWPRHAVLAVRGAVGRSQGDAPVARPFFVGGIDENRALGAFGSDAIGLLRGFPDTAFAGRHATVVNVEARVPLAWPQRGIGTWPIFLKALHAAAFLDAGHAWDRSFDWRDRKTGVGVELSADVVAGYGLPLTWTAGVAWGRDGADLVPAQRAFYLRVGGSF
jgi:hypothetical protein